METGHTNLKWNTMKTCMCSGRSFTKFLFISYLLVPPYIQNTADSGIPSLLPRIEVAS